MQAFIGIDVSKSKLDICVIIENSKIRKKIVKNSESGFMALKNWITKLDLQDSHICMEATGCYSEGVATFFHDLKFKVSVVNPLVIKSFRNSKLVRQKTDSSDAYIIAEFCKQNTPKPWKPRNPDEKSLHEFLKRLDSLTERLKQITNQLENKNLDKIIVNSIKKESRNLGNEIEKLNKTMMKIVQNNTELKQKYELLSNIKGIGEKTALTILADMPDVSSFKSSRQYVAFAGLSPSHFQSGTSVKGKSHISKIGSKRIRKVLYMSALSVKRYNSDFAHFVQKMKSRGNAPKVIIVAIMRKLLCIFFGILKTRESFDRNLAFFS